MKILITGGLGYIGSKLVEHLYHYDNVELVVLDNFSFPGQEAIAASMLSRENRLKIIRADLYEGLNNPDILEEVLSSDVIVHLAAIVGMPACNNVGHSITYMVNQLATDKLVSILRPDQHIIFPNTNSAYGNSKEEICTEDSPMNPVSTYGDSKCKAEQSVKQHKKHTIFRLATVFGVSPRMRLDLMVNDFVYRGLYNKILPLYEGHFRRNFVHVNDVCRAIVYMIKNRHYGIFNLGDDRANMTKLQLAQLVSKFTQCKVEEEDGRDPDQRNYLVSNQKIQSTGFNIKHPIEEGINELLSLFSVFPSNRQERERVTKGMRNV